MATPITLSEIWQQMILSVGGPSGVDDELRVLMLTYAQYAGAVQNNAAFIQGIPVSATPPTNGQVIEFNSGLDEYVPATPVQAAVGGDLSGTLPNPTVAKIQGVPVSSTPPTAGQTLVDVGGTWVPTTTTTIGVPYGHLYGTSGTAINDNTVTVTGLTGRSAAGHGMTASGSAGTLTASVAGVYRVNATVQMGTVGAGAGIWTMAIQLNGTTVDTTSVTTTFSTTLQGQSQLALDVAVPANGVLSIQTVASGQSATTAVVGAWLNASYIGPV